MKVKRVFLKVHSAYDYECVAVVDLTLDKVDKFLTLIELFHEFRDRLRSREPVADHLMYAFSVWDYSPTIIESSSCTLSEAELSDVESGLLVISDCDDSSDVGEPLYSDAMTATITRSEISWEGNIKHCDAKFTTDQMAREFLQGIRSEFLAEGEKVVGA